jgi:hypothetical protein
LTLCKTQAKKASAGATFIDVADIRGFKVGDSVAIGSGSQKETKSIVAILRNGRRARRAGE